MGPRGPGSVSSFGSDGTVMRGTGLAGANEFDGEMEQETMCQVLLRWATACKSGTIAVLYVMSLSASRSMSLDILLETFHCLQMMSLLLPPQTGIPFNLEPAIQSWAYFVSLFRLGEDVTGVLGNRVFTATGLALILLAILLGVYVGWAWLNGDTRNLWTIIVLRTLGGALATYLYIPVLTMLMGGAACDDSASWGCTTMSIITWAFCIVYAALAMIVAATFFDADPLANSSTTRSHTRVCLYRHVVNTVLVVLSHSMWGTSIAKSAVVQVLWVILTLAYSLSLAFSFSYYQPYYLARSNEIRAVLAWLVMWTVLSGPFARLVLPQSTSVETLFFCGFAFVIPIAILTVRSRRAELNTRPISKCRNVFEVELCCRPQDWRSMTPAEIEAITQKYTEAQIRFPKSVFLCMFQSVFLLSLKQSILPVRLALLQAERYDARIDQDFYIFKQKQKLKESLESSPEATRGVTTYVRTENHLSEARALDVRCCKMMMLFWGEVAKKENADLTKVVRFSNSVAALTSKATACYRRLVKQAPNSAKVLNLFAGYLHTVVNNAELADRMYVRAERAVNQRRLHNASNDADSMDETMAIVSVSASDDVKRNVPVGTVTHVNDQAMQLFGDGIVGRDLSQFLLPPWSHIFPSMASRYLENEDEHLLKRPVNAFCKNAKGELVPCTIVMRPFSEDGMAWAIVVSVMPVNTANRVALLADSATGFVFSMTMAAYGLFQVLPDDVASSMVTVSSIIQRYTDNRPTFIQPGPHAALMCNRRSLDDTGRLSIAVDVFEVDGSSVDIIDVTDVSDFQREIDGAGYQDQESLGSDPDADERNQPALASLSHEFTVDDNDVRRRVQFQTSPAKRDSLSSTGAPDDVDGASARDHPHPPSGSTPLDRSRRLSSIVDSGSESAAEAGADTQSAESETSSVAQARLARRALLKSHTAMDPSLRSFRNVYLAVVTLVLIASAMFYLVQTIYIGNYVAMEDAFALAVSRQYYLAYIAFNTYNLVLLNQGVPLVSRVDEQTVRRQIASAANRLLADDSVVYTNRHQFGSPVVDMYESSYVNLYYLVPGRTAFESTTLERSMGMFDATTQYASASNEVATMPLASFTGDNSLVFFILASSVGTIQSSFRVALSTSDALLTDHMRNYLSSLVTLGIVLAVLCNVAILAAVVAMLPKVQRIEGSKRETLMILATLPSSSIAMIKDNIKDRLETIHGVSASTLALSQEAGTTQVRRRSRRGRPTTAKEAVPAPAATSINGTKSNDDVCIAFAPNEPVANLAEENAENEADVDAGDANAGDDAGHVRPVALTDQEANQVQLEKVDSGKITSRPKGSVPATPKDGHTQPKDTSALPEKAANERAHKEGKKKKQQRQQKRKQQVAKRTGTATERIPEEPGGAKRRRTLPERFTSTMSGREAQVMVRISSIIVISLIYFVVAEIKVSDTANVLSAMPNAQRLAGDRHRQTMAITLLLQFLSAGVQLYGITDDSKANDITPTRILDAIVQLEKVEDLLIYGDPSSGMPGLLTQHGPSAPAAINDEFRLMMSNGCTGFIPDVSTVNETDCLAFMDGLVAGGLHNSLVNYARLARGLLSTISSTIATQPLAVSPNSTGVWSVLRHSDIVANNANLALRNVVELQTDYLNAIQTKSMSLYAQVANDLVPVLMKMEEIALVVFFMAVVFQYVLLVRPLIANLDLECKRTRLLLLLIPEERLAELHSHKQIVACADDIIDA